MIRPLHVVGVATIGALVGAGLAVTPVAARPVPAEGTVTTAPGFVGVPAGVTVDDPAVRPATPLVAAARTYVDRYAATLGVDAEDLVLQDTTRTVAGTDAVRFAQEVAGVPVVGGEVVVGLRSGRELGSAQATVSTRSRVAVPLVTEDAAAATARAVAARSAGVPAADLTVTRAGRWLLDPAVLGAPARLGTHTVWRFDVADGVAVRRLVLVDVRTGVPVMDLDAIQHLDRVVCDLANAAVADESDCVSDFARTEADAPTGIADVDAAFDFSGAVAEFYDEIGGVDLTEALGIPVDGVKKLTSTVRLCIVDKPCPFPNAFWNGRGMFYGADYASADDVVGHEMTHGIIDQHSKLFYWGQSGAINESIADIMGEIVDHRTPTPGDGPDDWRMGEDLPIGAVRDMADPTRGGDPALADPDSMTSPYYDADLEWKDAGGVHSNSGVGNKTAYLISQGGTFGGRTVAGIDVGDPGLTKTATLYLQVLQVLASGSDYAALADVLDQSCQDLVGTAGFTVDDCVQVHEAGLATRLRTTPTNAPLPADAPATCPTGTSKRLLLDSEVGDPESTFTAGPTWSRGGNATSGTESWYSTDPPTTGASTLAATRPVRLPAGQRSFLWFEHWWLLDFDKEGFYDGGVVEVDGRNAARLPWVNGPEQVLATDYDNPAGGQLAFGGYSDGFVASRVDLSSYAGRSVRPGFTMASDNDIAETGWFVDDIRVYTCDPEIVNTKRPSVGGPARVGATLTARPGRWDVPGARFAYAWLRDGRTIAGATGKSYVLRPADRGARVAVRVTARTGDLGPVRATSKAVGPIR